MFSQVSVIVSEDPRRAEYPMGGWVCLEGYEYPRRGRRDYFQGVYVLPFVHGT